MAHLTARRIKTAYLFIHVATCVLSRCVVLGEGYSYHFHADKAPNADAAARLCNANGMELIRPSTQAEIDAIKSAIDRQIRNKEVYTGLVVSDVPTSSPLWKSTIEPSRDEDCVTLNLEGSWKLSDSHCTARRAYVCQQSDVAELRREVDTLKTLVKQTVAELDESVKERDARITEMEQTIHQMESEMVASASHVESGTLRCGSTIRWTDGDVTLDGIYFPYSKQITVSFAQPYVTPPTVFLSDVSRTVTNTDGDRWDSYATGVMEVTTTGFTMACVGWAASRDDSGYSYVLWLRVNWLSVSV